MFSSGEFLFGFMSAMIHTCKGSDLVLVVFVFFFQAEDGIRDLVRSRGLGDVYKRQRHSPLEPMLRRRRIWPTDASYLRVKISSRAENFCRSERVSPKSLSSQQSPVSYTHLTLPTIYSV